MATLTLKRKIAAGTDDPFWMVWKPGSDKITKRHETFEAASAEAQRLSKMHADRAFYVLQAKAHFGPLE